MQAAGRARAIMLGGACATAAIYFYRLGSAPMVIGGDEAFFATHAHAIATTGRDLDGRFLPLFFRIDIHTWYQPLLVYLMAAVFSVTQVSEAALRAPTAAMAVLSVMLTYAVALRILGRPRDAAIAALALALAPAHFLFARQGLDYIAPLPFVLAWLWCLLVAIETGRVGMAALAGVLLGVGFYSYVAAWVVMPTCLAISVIAVARQSNRIRLAGAAIVGFLLPMLLLVAWLQAEPGTVRNIFARYGMGDGTIRNAFRYFVIQRRLSLYWAYFDPVYMFLVGSANVSMSTGKAGVFLLPGAILLPLGMYDAVRRRDARLIVLAVFVLSPLAPVLIDAGNAIQRSLVMVPFGAVLMAGGASVLLSHSSRWVRGGAMALLVAMPLQWMYFARDYFDEYPVRSAGWIDPTSLAGAVPEVLPPGPSRVYLSESLDDGEARWRFQLAKSNRDDLWERTWIVDGSGTNVWSVQNRLDPVPVDTHPPPRDSVFIVGVTSPAVERLTRDGACCTVASTVAGASGQPVLAIIRPR